MKEFLNRVAQKQRKLENGAAVVSKHCDHAFGTQTKRRVLYTSQKIHSLIQLDTLFCVTVFIYRKIYVTNGLFN